MNEEISKEWLIKEVDNFNSSWCTVHVQFFNDTSKEKIGIEVDGQMYPEDIKKLNTILEYYKLKGE